MTPHALEPTAGTAVLAAAGALAVVACGGGGAADPVDDVPSGEPGALSPEQASRLLSQAAFGGNAAQIERLRTLGRDAWLDEQFNLPRGPGYVDLISPVGADFDGGDGRIGMERALWRKLIGSPDLLRQRVTLVLSEIFVISLAPVPP